MKESIIKLENVSYNYGEYRILQEINLDIKTDAFTVLIGHSGSGKSILLKIMATIVSPDTGTIKLFGNDITGYDYMKLIPLKKRIGFAFQDGALMSNLSVEENLLLPLDFHYKDISRKIKRDRIHDFLKKLMMEETINQRPAELSSGEKKIISIVRAMIVEPEILFLDEPLAFMDATVAKTIIMLINEYAVKENTTVVCVSNSKRIIKEYSEEIAIIENGKIIMHDKKDAILGMDPEERNMIINDILGY